MKRKTFLIFAASGLALSCGSYGFLRDVGSFFSAFVRDPGHVASVIPSSRFTSRAMSRQVSCTGAPVKILELGAGTGPITTEIVKKMRGQDSLDLIEFNPDFCEILQKKFGAYKNVHIHCISVFDWDPGYEYDFIISALPHNTFGKTFVGALLEKYQRLIKPDGKLTYIELALMGKLKRAFLSGEKKIDYQETHDLIVNFRERFFFQKETVLRNIPPAYVYHLKIKK